MSSLIPERQIVISPSLATTIGLEEAVLLQILNDATIFGHATIKQNYQWFTINHDELINLLPFWDIQTLQRIINSLIDKGIILTESRQSDNNTSLCFAMNEQPQKVRQQSNVASNKTSSAAINRQPAYSQQTAQNYNQHLQQDTMTQRGSQHGSSQHGLRTSPQHGATLISKDWQPDEDLLQLMELSHNIPRKFALQQQEDFLLYWIDRNEVAHSWSSKFRQHLLKEWRFQQSRDAQAQAQTSQHSDINANWKPSPDALEILHRTGVTPEFIEDAIPEFVLYWGERGEASRTWNSKFIAHIRRQWAKYTKTLELDYEPRVIAANWQPSEDVYDILRLANIDIIFARKLVPEFVLFWRDTQEIQRSWNTKFLQHVKYQWATRHHLEKHYAGQPISDQSAQQSDQSPFKQLTDRSWAEGIAEGI